MLSPSLMLHVLMLQLQVTQASTTFALGSSNAAESLFAGLDQLHSLISCRFSALPARLAVADLLCLLLSRSDVRGQRRARDAGTPSSRRVRQQAAHTLDRVWQETGKDPRESNNRRKSATSERQRRERREELGSAAAARTPGPPTSRCHLRVACRTLGQCLSRATLGQSGP